MASTCCKLDGRVTLSTKLRTLVRRAPKNARSNRWWILWGGKLYFRSRDVEVSIPEAAPPGIQNWVVRARKYVSLRESWKGSPIFPQSSALLLTELGMFGNMSRRLGSALSIGSAIGCGAVAVPQEVIFHREIFCEGVHGTGFAGKFWFGVAPDKRNNSIKALLVGDTFSASGLDAASIHEDIDQAWTTLHGLLSQGQGKQRVESKALAIHLRGGDVFGSRKPKAYGQPPLAFYEFVLRQSNWRSVVIVHQDHSNPVLPEIQELCRKLNLEFKLQSGPVVEDIAALLKAETIVAGRGTFIPAVANLSRHCRRVFYFEDKCNLVPRRTGIELIRVSDQEKTYKEAILSNNWQNTPEQRDLMVSYPMSSLVIEGS